MEQGVGQCQSLRGPRADSTRSTAAIMMHIPIRVNGVPRVSLWYHVARAGAYIDGGKKVPLPQHPTAPHATRTHAKWHSARRGALVLGVSDGAVLTCFQLSTSTRVSTRL